jgi:hypothetical protein
MDKRQEELNKEDCKEAVNQYVVFEDVNGERHVVTSRLEDLSPDNIIKKIKKGCFIRSDVGDYINSKYIVSFSAD